VKSCNDNSEGNCIVEYFGDDLDENGKAIDYSKFRRKGEYTVKLIAKDETGNQTTPQEVKLTISVKEASKPEEKPSEETTPEPEKQPEPETCTYGDLTVNSSLYNFPAAVIVGDKNKNCAINRDLWDNDSIVNNVNNFYNADYQKLKTDLKLILEKEFPYGANIVAYPQYSPILNEAGTGLVGYGIYVTVYINPANTEEKVDQEKNLKLAYYIKADSSREYKTNVYNIK
jgi:hypothetical protein